MRWTQPEAGKARAVKQTFHFGGYTWDIDAAEKITDKAERERLEVAPLAHLMRMIRVNQEYAMEHPSPDAPILLAALPSGGELFHMPIDGWHRIAYWNSKGAETVSAFVFSPQDSYDLLLGGRESYRKEAKKAGIPLSSKRKR